MARINYKRLVPLFAALIVALAGCARIFPSEVMDRVDKNVRFSDLLKQPEAYKGKTVLLAGSIIGMKAEKDGSTYLEVLQRPAERSGRPMGRDKSEGRFIAVSKQFLDPAVYSRGREVTIVGRVIGDSVKPLGEYVYRYPLLDIEAVHVWDRPYGYGPRAHISVGIGIGIIHRF
jgi:outer membrane lipoprotein